MAKKFLTRKSSIPSYLLNGPAAIEVEETDLRWRRSSHAAISAMLPSYGAFHSDTGLTLTRSITDPQRRKSVSQRRKSMAALREIVMKDEMVSRSATTRQLLKGISTLDQWFVSQDDQHQVVESIRSMTACIAVKRKYRDQILSKEQSTLHGCDVWKYQVAMRWLQFKNWTKSLAYFFELWAGAFKQIEGKFGTATMSYFRFLRWLMFLNLFMAVFMLGTILLPFLFLSPRYTSDFAISVNQCASNYHYEAVYFSTNYTETVNHITHTESTQQAVLDILKGTGWLENTVLFYGAYHNKTSHLPGGATYTYNMSLAYLLAVGATFLLSFVLLVKNSAKGMKESVLMSSSGNMTLYCNKLFGAWDFCITQNKTAQLKHQNILQDFWNELNFQRQQWKKAGRTKRERAKLYSIRLLINILVVIILTGSLFLIYFSNEQLLKIMADNTMDDVVQLLVQYLPSITITILNVIVPIIFNKVVIAEDYMPAFMMKITLTRTVLLRLASVGVLMLSMYNTVGKIQYNKHIDMLCDNLTPENMTSTNVTNTTTPTDDKTIYCWETYVGQQIYKLVMLNFIVVVVVTFIWEFPRKLLFTKFHEKFKPIDLLGQQQFNLSKSVLDLVYLQTLCWLGLFFSPIIPAMCFVKCFIFFYVKKTSLLHNCLPTQQYGTSRSNSLFMTVLLLSFGLASIPIIYMIGSIQPSQACGPFRVYSSRGFIMFDTISNLVSSFDKAKDFVFFLGTGGFMAMVAFLLCLLMYYFWIVGQAHHKMSKSLREQLKLEGQDKQFLLARVNEVRKFT